MTDKCLLTCPNPDLSYPMKLSIYELWSFGLCCLTFTGIYEVLLTMSLTVWHLLLILEFSSFTKVWKLDKIVSSLGPKQHNLYSWSVSCSMALVDHCYKSCLLYIFITVVSQKQLLLSAIAKLHNGDRIFASPSPVLKSGHPLWENLVDVSLKLFSGLQGCCVHLLFGHFLNKHASGHGCLPCTLECGSCCSLSGSLHSGSVFFCLLLLFVLSGHLQIPSVLVSQDLAKSDVDEAWQSC